jgi:hypothetical protein
MSKAAALQREQRALKAASDYLSWDLDEDDDDEDDAEIDDVTDYDADDADNDGSLRQQQQQQQRRLGGGSSNVRRLLGRGSSSGSSGWGLVGSQQRGYRHQRRAPDLLEFVECTKPAGSDTAAAAGVGLASMTSRAAALAAGGGDGGVKGLPLNLPLDRYGSRLRSQQAICSACG